MKIKQELLGVVTPKETCTDQKCPFHGGLTVKRELFTGRIVKKDINHTATIQWFRPYYVPKYERYEMRKSTMRVHNPPCLEAAVGQEVLVARTRPISKTKNHVVIKIVDEKRDLAQEDLLKEGSKEQAVSSEDRNKEIKKTKQGSLKENESS